MSGKRGPKVKLTDSERKRRKKERNATVNKCRISIGDQIGRQDELKNQLAIENNAEMAKVLLDWQVYFYAFFTKIIESFYITLMIKSNKYEKKND